jgi:hypothetical protein
MTGAEVLAFAASHGVRVTLAFGDLRLKIDRESAPEALDALRNHKEAVVAELGRIAAAGQLRQTFEANVAAIVRVRSLPRPEAERIAFDNLVTERLNSTHPDTPSDRCAYCDHLETPDNTLLPFGAGSKHAWLHGACWEQWRTQRRVKAVAELAALGIDLSTKTKEAASS